MWYAPLPEKVPVSLPQHLFIYACTMLILRPFATLTHQRILLGGISSPACREAFSINRGVLEERSCRFVRDAKCHHEPGNGSL